MQLSDYQKEVVELADEMVDLINGQPFSVFCYAIFLNVSRCIESFPENKENILETLDKAYRIFKDYEERQVTAAEGVLQSSGENQSRTPENLN